MERQFLLFFLSRVMQDYLHWGISYIISSNLYPFQCGIFLHDHDDPVPKAKGWVIHYWVLLAAMYPSMLFQCQLLVYLCVRLMLNMDGIPVVFSGRKTITMPVTWDEFMLLWNALRYFFSGYVSLSGI